MISTAVAQKPTTARARFRLDVKEPGGPLLPRSFHETYEEAWDAGEFALFGKVFAEHDVLPDAPRGWDFIIREMP